LQGLQSFEGLAHRVELVDEFDGIAWIDDSKGTNVGATEAALNGMTRQVVLIAGGDGKGQDFSPLAPACQRIARAVLLIGRDAGRIRAALADSAVRCRTAPRWKRPPAPPPNWPSRVMWCCCRRPAPAWTCSAITPIAPRCSSIPWQKSRPLRSERGSHDRALGAPLHRHQTV
jgi:hypothetical protein